jgi:hypothetical protein
MLEEVAIGPVLVAPSTTLTAAPAPAATVNDALTSPAHTSPSLELDAATGIVVIQYRNQEGQVELSIPNQQQLNAYAANPLSAFTKSGSTNAGSTTA